MSWSDGGYAVGTAVSESGGIGGPWRQLEKPLFPQNGGHGMIFSDLQGKLRFTLRFPNNRFKESPRFYGVLAKEGALRLNQAVIQRF